MGKNLVHSFMTSASLLRPDLLITGISCLSWSFYLAGLCCARLVLRPKNGSIIIMVMMGLLYQCTR